MMNLIKFTTSFQISCFWYVLTFTSHCLNFLSNWMILFKNTIESSVRNAKLFLKDQQYACYAKKLFVRLISARSVLWIILGSWQDMPLRVEGGLLYTYQLKMDSLITFIKTEHVISILHTKINMGSHLSIQGIKLTSNTESLIWNLLKSFDKITWIIWFQTLSS